MKTIPAHIVTGFMDAGKTTYIQDLIFRDYFHKREQGKTLIIVFEPGETEYDTDRLQAFRTDVVFWEGGDLAAFLCDVVNEHRPNRIFVEANGMMPELPGILAEMLNIKSTTMLIDAETLDLYYRNMLQLLQDMVKLADPVIINRAESKEELAPYATAFRLMNQRSGFLWESPMGYHEKVFGNALPFDRMQDHLSLSDADYPLWYLDALEYPEHYIGKEIELDVQIADGKAGRTVMTCCMNDIQFLGFSLESSEPLPAERSFIHLTAKAGAVFDPLYRKNRLTLKALDLYPIPFPANQILSVRSGS